MAENSEILTIILDVKDVKAAVGTIRTQVLNLDTTLEGLTAKLASYLTSVRTAATGIGGAAAKAGAELTTLSLTLQAASRGINQVVDRTEALAGQAQRTAAAAKTEAQGLAAAFTPVASAVKSGITDPLQTAVGTIKTLGTGIQALEGSFQRLGSSGSSAQTAGVLGSLAGVDATKLSSVAQAISEMVPSIRGLAAASRAAAAPLERVLLSLSKPNASMEALETQLRRLDYFVTAVGGSFITFRLDQRNVSAAIKEYTADIKALVAELQLAKTLGLKLPRVGGIPGGGGGGAGGGGGGGGGAGGGAGGADSATVLAATRLRIEAAAQQAAARLQAAQQAQVVRDAQREAQRVAKQQAAQQERAAREAQRAQEKATREAQRAQEKAARDKQRADEKTARDAARAAANAERLRQAEAERVVRDTAKGGQNRRAPRNSVDFTGDLSANVPGNEVAQKLTAAFRSLERPVARLRVALLNLQTAFAFFGGSAIFKQITSSAAETETSFARVNTILGESSISLDQYRDQLQGLAGATGQQVTDAANGLYTAISGGIKSTNDASGALATVNAAAVLATGGFTSLEKATEAIISVQNAYNRANFSATEIADKLAETVVIGRTEIGKMAKQLGRVAELGDQLNIPLDELLGSFAEITRVMPSTAEAITLFRSLLVGISSPAKGVQDQLKNIGAQLKKEGLEKLFSASSIKAKGLVRVLEELSDALGNNTDAFGALFPNIRADQAALILAAEGIGRLRTATTQLSKSQGRAAQQFAAVAKTYENTTARARQRIRAVFDDIGQKLLPRLGESFTKLADFVEKNASKIEKFVLGAADAFLSLADQLKGLLFALQGSFVVNGVKDFAAAVLGLVKSIGGLTNALKFLVEAALINKLLSIGASVTTFFGGIATSAGQAARAVSAFGAANAASRALGPGASGAQRSFVREVAAQAVINQVSPQSGAAGALAAARVGARPIAGDELAAAQARGAQIGTVGGQAFLLNAEKVVTKGLPRTFAAIGAGITKFGAILLNPWIAIAATAGKLIGDRFVEEAEAGLARGTEKLQRRVEQNQRNVEAFAKSKGFADPDDLLRQRKALERGEVFATNDDVTARRTTSRAEEVQRALTKQLESFSGGAQVPTVVPPDAGFLAGTQGQRAADTESFEDAAFKLLAGLTLQQDEQKTSFNLLAKQLRDAGTQSVERAVRDLIKATKEGDPLATEGVTRQLPAEQATQAVQTAQELATADLLQQIKQFKTFVAVPSRFRDPTTRDAAVAELPEAVQGALKTILDGRLGGQRIELSGLQSEIARLSQTLAADRQSVNQVLTPSEREGIRPALRQAVAELTRPGEEDAGFFENFEARKAIVDAVEKAATTAREQGEFTDNQGLARLLVPRIQEVRTQQGLVVMADESVLKTATAFAEKLGPLLSRNAELVSRRKETISLKTAPDLRQLQDKAERVNAFIENTTTGLLTAVNQLLFRNSQDRDIDLKQKGRGGNKTARTLLKDYERELRALRVQAEDLEIRILKGRASAPVEQARLAAAQLEAQQALAGAAKDADALAENRTNQLQAQLTLAANQVAEAKALLQIEQDAADLQKNRRFTEIKQRFQDIERQQKQLGLDRAQSTRTGADGSGNAERTAELNRQIAVLREAVERGFGDNDNVSKIGETVKKSLEDLPKEAAGFRRAFTELLELIEKDADLLSEAAVKKAQEAVAKAEVAQIQTVIKLVVEPAEAKAAANQAVLQAQDAFDKAVFDVAGRSLDLPADRAANIVKDEGIFADRLGVVLGSSFETARAAILETRGDILRTFDPGVLTRFEQTLAKLDLEEELKLAETNREIQKLGDELAVARAKLQAAAPGEAKTALAAQERALGVQLAAAQTGRQLTEQDFATRRRGAELEQERATRDAERALTGADDRDSAVANLLRDTFFFGSERLRQVAQAFSVSFTLGAQTLGNTILTSLAEGASTIASSLSEPLGAAFSGPLGILFGGLGDAVSAILDFRDDDDPPKGARDLIDIEGRFGDLSVSAQQRVLDQVASVEEFLRKQELGDQKTKDGPKTREEAAQQALDSAISRAEKSTDAIAKVFPKLLTQFVTSLVDKLPDLVQALATAIGEGIANLIKDLPSLVLSAIKSVFLGIGGFAKGLFGGIFHKGGTVPHGVSNRGMARALSGMVPAFASGGYVPSLQQRMNTAVSKDDVVALLQPGERVVSLAELQRVGGAGKMEEFISRGGNVSGGRGQQTVVMPSGPAQAVLGPRTAAEIASAIARALPPSGATLRVGRGRSVTR
jgi:TP901 family phage tail tape measure protein